MTALVALVILSTFVIPPRIDALPSIGPMGEVGAGCGRVPFLLLLGAEIAP